MWLLCLENINNVSLPSRSSTVRRGTRAYCFRVVDCATNDGTEKSVVLKNSSSDPDFFKHNLICGCLVAASFFPVVTHVCEWV